MELIDQKSSIVSERLKNDRPTFWYVPEYDGLECLDADFHSHAYAPHRHETYALGVVSRGIEAFSVNGVKHYAGAGNFCLINPEDLHDGKPHEADGFTYHMIYPSVGFISRLAEEIFETPLNGTLGFVAPTVHDPALAEAFRLWHQTLRQSHDTLGRDEALLMIMRALFSRHAQIKAKTADGVEVKAVHKVRDYIEAHFAEDVTLDDLAGVSGLNRHYLIRVFKREMGLTPHKFLVDCRVRAVRAALRSGKGIIDAALDAGFYDQSHMTHAFKSVVGVTPGAYVAGIKSNS